MGAVVFVDLSAVHVLMGPDALCVGGTRQDSEPGFRKRTQNHHSLALSCAAAPTQHGLCPWLVGEGRGLLQP